MSVIGSLRISHARLACAVIVAANLVALPTLAGWETAPIHLLLCAAGVLFAIRPPRTISSRDAIGFEMALTPATIRSSSSRSLTRDPEFLRTRRRGSSGASTGFRRAKTAPAPVSGLRSSTRSREHTEAASRSSRRTAARPSPCASPTTARSSSPRSPLRRPQKQPRRRAPKGRSSRGNRADSPPERAFAAREAHHDRGPGPAEPDAGSAQVPKQGDGAKGGGPWGNQGSSTFYRAS
jgi:hypothetical protein